MVFSCFCLKLPYNYIVLPYLMLIFAYNFFKLCFAMSKYMKCRIQHGNARQLLFEYAIKVDSLSKSFFDIHSIQDAIELNYDFAKGAIVHDFYLMIWFEKGSGRYDVDFQEYIIQDGTALFVSPRHIHQIKELYDYKGYCIIFTEEFLFHMSEMMRKVIINQFFCSYKGPSICYVNDVDDLEEMRRQISCIIYEFENGSQLFGHQDQLAQLLCSFFISLKRIGAWINFETIYDKQDDYYYHIFINYVEGHFCQIHEVKEYAKALNVSVGTLTKGVMKISGLRPSEIINKRIILEAKRLLCYSSELKVKQVAEKLGYYDVSNFVKFFKHNVGMTPMNFRKR